MCASSMMCLDSPTINKTTENFSAFYIVSLPFIGDSFASIIHLQPQLLIVSRIEGSIWVLNRILVFRS